MMKNVPTGPKHELAVLIQHYVQGLFSFMTAIRVAAHPDAKDLLPSESGRCVPCLRLPSAAGNWAEWDGRHYLDRLSADPRLIEDLQRVWLAEALLNIRDALKPHDYFDHAPELEMIYHLRNGIAHGNRFAFTAHGLKRLARYPASTKHAMYMTSSSVIFAISPQVQGRQVLFDFMEAGDLNVLLMSVRDYLLRQSGGLEGRPE